MEQTATVMRGLNLFSMMIGCSQLPFTPGQSEGRLRP
jgi:hypothetical protein